MKKDSFCSFKTLCIVSLFSAFIGVLLMLVRIWYAFSFSEPLQLTTSGWEEDSLYAMWKYIKGMKIYGDRHSIPYAVSAFNWLYYQSYGFVIKSFISLFSLDVSWIPTVGRFFTFIGTLIGVFVCYTSFIKLSQVKDPLMKVLALSFSLLVFFGPLVGFWAFTVRPDVWSFVFEVTGVFLFWRYYAIDKIKAIFFSALVLYCSWAFKQSGFLTVVAITLFLLVKKDFKALFIFLLLMIVFYSTTFLLGDKEYIDTIFLFHAERAFSFKLAIENILKAASKSPPAIITLISSIVYVIFHKELRREIPKNNSVLFSILLLFTTIIIVVPASAMEGASDNYCFMLLYSFSLSSIILFSKIYERGLTGSEKDKNNLRIFIGFIIFGWVMHVLSIMTVFLGYRGIVSVYPQHVEMIKKQRSIEKLPKPLFVDNMYLSLPWMNPSEPYVFTNWFYKKERESGLLFKDGGIGGLIKNEHYKTLLLPEKMKIFDGADLSKYKILPNKFEGFYVYVKQ